MDSKDDVVEDKDATNNKELKACSGIGCTLDHNDQMLRCTECKLLTHFGCTKLPAYQLFLYKTSKRRFLCEICTGEVPKEFHEHANQRITFSKLNELIKSLQDSLATKSEESKSYLDKAKEIKLHNNSLKQRIRDLEDQQVVLKKQINENEKIVTGYYSPKKSQIFDKDILTSIEKILDTKLELVEERLKTSVLNELQENKKIVDDKLEKMIHENKTYAESVKGTLINSDTLPNGVNFKSILKEANNDQLIEEEDRQRRSKNFIIHGLEEKGDDAEAVKHNDGVMTQLFFEKINIQARPLKYFRLGKAEPNKSRPLKLEMANSTERDLVMNNLKLLKGMEEELGKLSVKEDYTMNEREQIKNFVDIAKERNMKDKASSHYWVVRGTPKNGISLVKLTRR